MDPTSEEAAGLENEIGGLHRMAYDAGRDKVSADRRNDATDAAKDQTRQDFYNAAADSELQSLDALGVNAGNAIALPPSSVSPTAAPTAAAITQLQNDVTSMNDVASNASATVASSQSDAYRLTASMPGVVKNSPYEIATVQGQIAADDYNMNLNQTLANRASAIAASEQAQLSNLEAAGSTPTTPPVPITPGSPGAPNGGRLGSDSNPGVNGGPMGTDLPPTAATPTPLVRTTPVSPGTTNGGTLGSDSNPGINGGPMGTSQQYTVISGDTLSGIAEKYGVSLAAVEAANKESIPNPDLILPGQTVHLPDGAAQSQGGNPVSPTESDPATVAMNVDTHPHTDPLKIHK